MFHAGPVSSTFILLFDFGADIPPIQPTPDFSILEDRRWVEVKMTRRYEMTKEYHDVMADCST
jgi:hypothetical protein